MPGEDFLNRRSALATAALAGFMSAAPPAAKRCDAAEFGAAGDGRKDDSAALQAVLDQTVRNGGGVLTIPPGSYRVTRTLRIEAPQGGPADIVRQNGIVAHGARILSEIDGGGNVLEIAAHANHRFFLIDGLDILGSGREGHGVVLTCDRPDAYLYNFCLRDLVVQNCGGDGCRLIGNVFEGQILNSYFRGNHGNGATFMHGEHGGVLSAIHVFASVFGQNGAHGAALLHNCYDVAFHGCYLLLNGRFGLLAANGCTLLSNCGFENNHTSAAGYASGDAAISLNSFGTLIGCTSYSIYNQTALVRAFLTAPLTMVGCSGSGDRAAASAGLASIDGTTSGSATLIGCKGAVGGNAHFPVLRMGGDQPGLALASDWNSKNLLRLGEHTLWVGADGKLRLKKGLPAGDTDGKPIG